MQGNGIETGQAGAQVADVAAGPAQAGLARWPVSPMAAEAAMPPQAGARRIAGLLHPLFPARGESPALSPSLVAGAARSKTEGMRLLGASPFPAWCGTQGHSSAATGDATAPARAAPRRLSRGIHAAAVLTTAIMGTPALSAPPAVDSGPCAAAIGAAPEVPAAPAATSPAAVSATLSATWTEAGALALSDGRRLVPDGIALPSRLATGRSAQAAGQAAAAALEGCVVRAAGVTDRHGRVVGPARVRCAGGGRPFAVADAPAADRTASPPDHPDAPAPAPSAAAPPAVEVTGIGAPTAGEPPAMPALVGQRRAAKEGARRPSREDRAQNRAPPPGEAPGEDLAAMLIRAGAGYARPMAGDDACRAERLAAEDEARTARRGLWALAVAIAPAHDADAMAIRAGLFTVAEGRVLAAGATRERVYLNFGASWRQDFTVMIEREDFATILGDSLEPAALRGTLMRVRGVVQTDGGPAIAVRQAGEIVRLSQAGPARRRRAGE